jgi:thiol-disulfide isomerase/thioredoxin
VNRSIRKGLIWAVALGLATSAWAQPSGSGQQTVKEAYHGLSSGPLASAKVVALPKGIILRSGELRLTQKELDAEIRKSPKDVWPQLKKNLFFVLENRFTKSLITWEARSWAKTTTGAPVDDNSLIRAYLDSLTKGLAVTDEEIKSFYDSNEDMMGGATFDQVKGQLKDYVLQQKSGEIVQARINGLSDRYEVELDKDWIAKQYAAAADNPVDKARKSGKPSIVDFGADGCRPCDMMTPILESLKKDYAGKVNVLFVHVRKEQILAARYGVQSIPVQVFFDKAGKEVFRHVGFFPKDQMTAKLAEIGVN